MVKFMLGVLFTGWVFNAVSLYRKTWLGSALSAAVAAALLWWKL